MFAVVAMTFLCAVPLSLFFLILSYAENDHREKRAMLEAQKPDQ